MTRPQWIRRTWDRWVARHETRRTPVRRAWTAAAPGPGLEARAGALLRQAIVRQPMNETQLAAVRARLRRGHAPLARWTRPAQVVVGLAVMLVAGGLLGAARHFLSRPEPAIAPGAAPAVTSPPHAKHGRVRDDVTAPPIAPSEPILPSSDPFPPSAGAGRATAQVLRAASGAPLPVESAPIGAISDTHSRPRERVGERSDVASGGARSPFSSAVGGEATGKKRSPGSGASPPGPEVPSSRGGPTSASGGVAPRAASQLAEESRLLAFAQRQLRQDNDPTAALATLDEHAARFGQRGALVPEADTARVEVLLRLGRHSDALVLLDGMALATAGWSRSLLAARAELRAEQGRCSAASLDVDRLVEQAPEHDALAERALHGRAGCRAQSGDIAGARADLEAYLARFPDGRFAAEARSTLRR